MAKAGDVNMEVSLDRQSRDAIRSLVTAIDGLAKAINNGEKVDNALISEPVVQRLVEDIVKPDRRAGFSRGGYVDPPVAMHDVIH
jgi:hypothetical protein